jgi:hypothetical protein
LIGRRWLERGSDGTRRIDNPKDPLRHEITTALRLELKIVPVLVDGGFDGYLSSEYEGNRHIQDAYPVDSVEQVRRQHAMFARLLGEDA